MINKKTINTALLSAICLSALFLSNLRGSFLRLIFYLTASLSDVAWFELTCWAILITLLIYLIWKDGSFQEYLAAWKSNLPLLILIGLAFLSTSWSIDPEITFANSLILLITSLIAGYAGMRFSIARIIKYVSWVCALLVALSYATVIFLPGIGTMENPTFNGAWAGFFWHKNHLGAMAALFALVFLISIINDYQSHNGKLWIAVSFYLASLILIFYSRSAAGLIAFIVLHLITGLAMGWIGISKYLRPVHYYSLLGFSILISVALLTNINRILGLFNRNATFTGRSGLWSYLFRELISKRPWLGYGYNAVWNVEALRIQFQRSVGWPYQIQVGDNGLVDIILSMGVIGAIVTIGILIIAFFRTSRHFVSRKSLLDFFPLVFLLFILVANVSFSLFIETQFFIYMIFVMLLFTLGSHRAVVSS